MDFGAIARGAALVLVGLTLAGCAGVATQEDTTRLESQLSILRGDLTRQTTRLGNLVGEESKARARLTEEWERRLQITERELRKGQADTVANLLELQKEVADLRGGFDQARRLAQTGSTDVSTLREDLGKKVYFLENSVRPLEERVRTLERNTGTSQVQVTELDKRFNMVREEILSKIAELKEQLTRLASAFKEAATKPPLSPPAGPGAPPPSPQPPETAALSPAERDYQDARTSYQAGDFKGAKEKLKEFVRRYPESQKVYEAQYLIAESSFGLRNFEDAILEYDELLTKYPQGDKAPAAMFKQGLAFLELGDKIDARLLFNQVLTRFPASEEAKLATAKLQEMR